MLSYALILLPHFIQSVMVKSQHCNPSYIILITSQLNKICPVSYVRGRTCPSCDRGLCSMAYRETQIWTLCVFLYRLSGSGLLSYLEDAFSIGFIPQAVISDIIND